jgi:hypothetical protein
MRAVGHLPALAAFCIAAGGCAGSPEPVAFQNQVFYAKGAVSPKTSLAQFEQPYPPLDQQPAYVGVQVLEGAVRLSRPKAWVIRSASNTPQQRYIEYVSPDQYVVAIYERLESPYDPWRTVMQRYEEDVQQSGGVLLGKAVPVATWSNQGRAYLVQRSVSAPKAPLQSYTREYLLRSDRRIVLLQIVHPGTSIEPLSVELLRPLDTMQVD